MSLQFRLALRYLLGRKLRSALTTLAVAFGVMIVFGLNGIGPALETALRQGVAASSLHLPLLVGREAHLPFDARVVQAVGDVPGVERPTGAISRELFLPESQTMRSAGGREVATLEVFGIDPASGDWLFDVVVAEGRRVGSGRDMAPGDGNVVIISQDLSEGTGLGVGDSLSLPSASGTTGLEIIGILSGKGLVLGEEQLFMPLPAAQALFNMPGQVNVVAAGFAPGADEEAVKSAVLAVAGDGFEVTGFAGGADAWASAIQMVTLVSTMFGVLALAMAGLIMFNSFRTLVAERKRDIGLLRAVGASRGTVLRMVMVESLLQGLAGTALGIAAGYLAINAALPLLAGVWNEYFHVPMGDPAFTPLTWALAVGLGLGVPLLSGWLPARAASRVTPLEALRPAAIESGWRATARRLAVGALLIALALTGLVSGELGLASLGVVLFLVALGVIGPVLVRPIAQTSGRLLAIALARESWIAQGNLVRQPDRSAITASTVMIALAIVVALSGVATSATSGLLSYLERSLRADYLLVPESLVLGGGNVGAGPDLAASIREIPGITEVTTLRRTETLANDAGIQVIGVDPETYPRLSGLLFTAGEPDSVYAQLGEGRTIIVNGVYGASSGVKVGSEILLATAEGPRPYRVVGIGVDYMNAKAATGYISHANLERDFHETNDVLIMVNLEPGAGKAAVEAALLESARPYPAFGVISYERLRESQVAGTAAMNYAMYLVISLLAIPSLLALANTLGINVLERTREFGMLRAVGAARRQVRRIVLAESLILVSMGAAFGILGGIWLGYVLVQAQNAIGLPVPYYFPFGGILTAVALALLFGVLAAWLPARRAARLDVVRALAYE